MRKLSIPLCVLLILVICTVGAELPPILGSDISTTIKSSGTLLTSAPPPTSTTRPQIWVIAWGGLSTGFISTAAKFDYVMLGAEDLYSGSVVAGIKTANPHAKVVCGTGATFLDSIVSSSGLPESAFLHTQSGSRIQAQGANVMDPDSVDWRNRCLSVMQQVMATGYDGFWVDNFHGIIGDSYWDSGYPSSLWVAKCIRYIQWVKSATNNAIFAYNTGESCYRAYGDWQFREEWSTNVWGTNIQSYVPDELAGPGGYVAWNHMSSVTHQAFLFSYALYLIGYRDGATFAFNDIWNANGGLDYAEFSWDVGTPLGSYTANGNVWTRQFTKATISVDFSTQTGSISLSA